ncbi:MAG: M23 family metallopeptidase [Azoarcus sp.]|jgi:murein DD-endopeptidase MepM/ murein hydrolase activator NlpD|nr:M23 family metallopeptidase [Azoarcus sp.]
MRIKRNRILAELHWRLVDLRWRLAALPKRSAELRWRVGGLPGHLSGAGLRWHMRELRWRLTRPHPRLAKLIRRMAELPWRIFDNKRPLVIGGFAGVFVLGGVAATAVVVPEDPADMQTVLERLAVSPEELPAPGLPFIYDDSIGPGDTMQSIFQRLGIVDPEALAFFQGDKKVSRALRQLRSGRSLTAIVDISGRLLSLRLPLSPDGGYLNVARDAPNQSFQVTHSPETALEAGIEMRNGVIKYSLFAATEAAELPDNVASQLTDLFGTEIDFHADLRPGDTFSVIYETFYDKGISTRAGRIIAAEFINQGRRYAVFRHTTSDGKSDYYSSTGQRLRSTFLRSPLEFTKVTSGFGRRLHPVFGNWRNHQGVDFGAPTGTPVRATSGGEVSFVGYQSGYGNIVVLKHKGNVSTAYAHLSAFAPNLRPGDAIEQGETIGRVGATGRVSGPHLHYEFRIDNVAQNPMTVALPSSLPLAGKELSLFRENARLLHRHLALLGYRAEASDETAAKH